MFEKLFKRFLDSFVSDSTYSKSDYDYYSESIVDGNRKVIYGFYGKYDNEKKKDAIIKAMNHWSISDDYSNKYLSFVITFMFDGEECFNFTWDNDTHRFVTEDPDGSLFVYNFETNTIDRIDEDLCSTKLNDSCSEKQCDNTCEKESCVTNYDDHNAGTQQCVDYEKPCFELNQDLAKSIKNHINDKNEPEGCDSCDGCDIVFCPDVATDVFLHCMENGENYMAISDDGELIGVMMDIIELLEDDLYDRKFATKKDVYNYLYTNESAILDDFCESFVNDYGFSKCQWDAKKDENGDIDSLTIVWIF